MSNSRNIASKIKKVNLSIFSTDILSESHHLSLTSLFYFYILAANKKEFFFSNPILDLISSLNNSYTLLLFMSYYCWVDFLCELVNVCGKTIEIPLRFLFVSLYS